MDPLVGEATLRDQIAAIRRRWWLVVGAVTLCAGMAFAYSITRTPIYEAEAQMLVETRSTDTVFGTGIDVRGADATRAVQTEIKVLEGERVRTRLTETLDLDERPPAVNAAVIGSTDVISVRVRSSDPVTARALADAYVQAYIDERREQAVDNLLAASAQVQNKITELDDEIDALDVDDPQRDVLLAQQAGFRETLNQLQVDAALKTGGASVVKSAELPTEPVEPAPLRTTVLAAGLGLLLGLGLALIIDYFDDTVRTEHEVARVATPPVLAVVPVDRPVDNRPIAVRAPDEYAVEVYRALRTNLQFLALDHALKVIQVTSSVAGEGKTTTATNLAVVLAQSGKRVVVVDADLRRPRVHEVFATPRSPGLIDFVMDGDATSATRVVDLDGGASLAVIPSGATLGNPGELLASARVRELIRLLAEHFDYVILDSAPVLPVADSVALASSADAVVLVAQARRTTRRNLVGSIERLSRVGASVVGIVLNQAKRVGAGEYAYRYEQPRSEEIWVRPPDSVASSAPAADSQPAGPAPTDTPAVADAPLS